MLDPSFIATLEKGLQETRKAQATLISRLREVEVEAARLKDQIKTFENTAEQTEQMIDGLLVAMRSGNRSSLTSMSIEDVANTEKSSSTTRTATHETTKPQGTVAFFNRKKSSTRAHIEPVSNRFADRTITQACTLLLREAGEPLHVNDLYNLLVAGGMEFKGNNPTISVAVSLNRNRRFKKVGPGTFDLIMRDASRAAS
jgi:hypothetical protein